MCDENEVDVIIVTGSVGHLERNFVIKTIKNISDKQVSEKTMSLISNLETKLNETTFYRYSFFYVRIFFVTNLTINMFSELYVEYGIKR